MPAKPKHRLETVLKAIKGSGAIKETIAARLGVNRGTVNNYLKRWSTAREAFDQEKSVNLDMAKSVVLGNIRLAARSQRDTGEMVDTNDAWRYIQYVEGRAQRIDITTKGESLNSVDEIRAQLLASVAPKTENVE